jgi:low affinity Fe/Cu permease
MKAQRGSNPFSRSLHRVDHATARPAAAVVVLVLILVFGAALARAGFPQTWETAFAAVCAAVTTVMVFTIQHTQSREQAAIQLKLDELVRALPGADDHLVQVESGDDAEIEELEQRHLDHHVAVRADEN